MGIMGPDDFRRIALGMKDTVESAHMAHPDFRAGGRIFATLHADDRWGMVKLTPEQQQRFVRDNPGVFKPENGAWGREGCTAVRLDSVDDDVLGEALTLAHQNAMTVRQKLRGSHRRK
jgi:YjbR protein